MIYWQLFLAFFWPGILGYGGGPASIPLIEHEVVDRYGWMTVNEFSEVLALGNSLPGPIATKMAGYIGYEQAGVLGAAIGVFASVAPSLVLLLALLGLLYKWKDAPQVKRLTAYIRPAIAVMLGIMAIDLFRESYEGAWLGQTAFLTAASAFLLLGKWRIHPAYVIVLALVYGAFFLS
ncbi:Chromate transporter [Geobacillus thermoleovorans CCB_US3_UF5]|uniref:Chromate transporter n=1 Tax=Geobacillus thermoleovorans CCB_US3_UF5 TaxID=1111068 RepID=A0ABN4A3J5_GEOTH|nr:MULTISPECIES: chromate transporter [Geobacillus]AEV21050.1 Chromate transporter [Geobacillus thermoleovorans CCB_US3_UF5]QDY74830.1 chromate transporter [Geobacillus thermoleovorans]GAJ57203.1 chromate transporter [Geobacillus thermoleovorans B23]